jgi:hypothetical protein
MDWGTISRAFGWYTVEVTASLALGRRVVAGGRDRGIEPGAEVKVDPLDGGGYSTFTFVPALPKRGEPLPLAEAELRLSPVRNPGIGLPDFWLARRGVELGAVVLLRDDSAGPASLAVPGL